MLSVSSVLSIAYPEFLQFHSVLQSSFLLWELTVCGVQPKNEQNLEWWWSVVTVTERLSCPIIWLTYISHILSCISAGNYLWTGPAFPWWDWDNESHSGPWPATHCWPKHSKVVETDTHKHTHTGCLGGHSGPDGQMHKNGKAEREKRENNYGKESYPV